MFLLSAIVFRLNPRIRVWQFGSRLRLRKMDSRRRAAGGIRVSKCLLAASPSSFRFSISNAAIFARCDLPDPKYPEIQTPISSVRLKNVSV